MNGILPNLIAYIDEKKERYRKIGAKDAVVINKYVIPVDTPVQALLTCKVVFDHVFAPRSNKHAITTIAMAVGHAVEAECQMEYYDKEAPALLATLKRTIGTKPEEQNISVKCIQTLMHKQNITPWVAWDRTSKVKLVYS